MGQSRDRLFSSMAAWSISRDGLRLDLFYQKQWLGGAPLLFLTSNTHPVGLLILGVLLASETSTGGPVVQVVLGPGDPMG